MEELSIYDLTITEDHRLKVNNEEVGGDDSILPGDSEGLLAWALMQVGYSQQDSPSSMNLYIEDQRPDGYGTQRVTIPPGRQVLIESLRKRTGKDLSYITEQVRQQYEAGSSAPQPPAEEPSSGGDENAWDDSNDAEEDVLQGEEAPASSPTTIPTGDQDAEWTETAPGPTSDSEPALAPLPALDEGVADTSETTSPPTAPDLPSGTPRRAYDQPLPENSPAEMPPDAGGWEQAHAEQFPEDWPSADDPGETTAPNDDEERLPPLPPFAPGTQGDEPAVTEHEIISSKQIAYKRDRPELGEGEAKEVEGKKPKKERSKPMIVALIIVSLVAAVLLVQLVRSQGDNSYVATCIDERTMVRQASEAGCESGEAPYYRWWYTPSGSEVPAVNQTVSQAEGTRVRPQEATIREGYDPQGGLYGDESD